MAEPAVLRLTDVGQNDTTFDPEKCIICQKKSANPTSSSDNGRRKIQEAASVRNDEVSKRLRLIGGGPFVYHVTNSCYKGYTLQKTIDRIAAKRQERAEEESPDVTNDSQLPGTARRSSVTPRDKPSNQCDIYSQKCVVCGCVKHNKKYDKYRISESDRASKFLEATVFFLDEVYTRTCDLQGIESVFGADLYCHNPCINRYLLRYERERKRTVTAENPLSWKKKAWASVLEVIETGLPNDEGYELSFVRNLMNRHLDSENAESRPMVTNREVKLLLTNHFGDSTCFSKPKQANKSMMVFYRGLSASDMAEIIRGSNSIKQCAELLRESLKSVDFDLNDRFCDTADLRESWDTVPIPDPLLKFFTYLFNCDVNDLGQRGQIEEADGDDTSAGTCKVSKSRRLQIHSMFQMMYYILHNGRKRTPLHIMNSEAIYDACKSATLITSFNHLGVCTSYDELMRFQSDMASYTVEASEGTLPFPSHFNRTMFTMGAFDNFDHDEATLSGIGGSHDTVTVLFQDHGGVEERRFGTKHAAIKADPEKYLLHFGTMNNIDGQIVAAEEYLVQVFWKSQNTCKTLDQLRCHLYHHAKCPCLDDLPPTSNATELHIKRAFYATNQMISVLAKTNNDILDPCFYGFEVLDELLVPQEGRNPIPEEYTIRCNCSKCATERCSCRKKTPVMHIFL